MFEQNKVPEPGPQGRLFSGNAGTHPHSSEHAVDFPTHDTSVCIFCSKALLDHVWLVNVNMLSLFEQLRRSKLPSFLAEVVHS